MEIVRRGTVPLILALAACAGGPPVYPDTDVVEIREFGPPKNATGVQKDRGTMQSGTLEYGGQGELMEVFRNYIAAMKILGWQSRNEEVTGEKATATLMKDVRTCSLQFTQSQGTIRAVIKVTSQK